MRPLFNQQATNPRKRPWCSWRCRWSREAKRRQSCGRRWRSRPEAQREQDFVRRRVGCQLQTASGVGASRTVGRSWCGFRASDRVGTCQGKGRRRCHDERTKTEYQPPCQGAIRNLEGRSCHSLYWWWLARHAPEGWARHRKLARLAGFVRRGV